MPLPYAMGSVCAMVVGYFGRLHYCTKEAKNALNILNTMDFSKITGKISWQTEQKLALSK